MKKLVLLAAAVLGFSAAPALAQTATGTFSGNGHTYQWYNTATTFDGALAAGTGGGYLVTVTSAAEEAFLRTLTGGNTVFASGSDRETEGVWKWLQGPEAGQIFFGPGAAAGSYTNWNSGEPNNVGNEDALHIFFGAGWNDIPENSNYGYVLEFDAVPSVPEPATWGMMLLGFLGLGTAIRRRRAGGLSLA